MKIKWFVKVVFCITVIFVNSNVLADGVYFGGGFGTASWDLKPLGVFDLEDNTALNLFWGARTQNFGGELSFAFSDHDWKGTGGQATHNASNLVVAGLGYLPLASTLDLYGKVGLNFWHTTVDFIGTNYDGDDGIDMTVGFGLNITVSPTFLLRLQYDYLPGLGDGLDDGDITMMTVNFAYVYR